MKYFVGIVLLIVLIGGGYFIYTNYLGTPAVDSQGTPTDQVQAQDVKVGTGTAAGPGAIVSVLYVGRLQDGTVFDSSEAHGNEPLVFQLGAPGIIPGFQIGVNTMKVGGERVIAVPPELGYGGEDVTDPATSKVIIPANSTLVFNVQLIKVEPAPAGTSTTSTAQ